MGYCVVSKMCVYLCIIKNNDKMNVANEILTQLGGQKFIAMTGSKNFVGSKDGLTFKVGSGTKNKTTHVEIKLNGLDLYNVRFLKCSIKAIKVISEHENIYFDMLRPLFTEQTGFYTNL